MSKGFGAKQQTKQQYILNFFASSKKLLAGFETPEEARAFYSKKWFDECIDSNNDHTLEQLLNPTHREIAVHVNPIVNRPAMRKIVLSGFNGIWRVLLLERPDKSLDLDIGVAAGSCYRFHSEVIKQNISSRFGVDIYHKWRELVRSDINSLKELVQIIKTQIDTIPWSYTCSQSSARLCEQVGIDTHRGIAFLFPTSYS